MSKISIVVPVYNVEKYLQICIDSILNQTFTDFELILIDDGSKDSSGRICDEFGIKDERIKVLHQENRGLSVARNIGINASKGDFIVFIDSDDFIHPNMLETLLGNLISTNSDISICSFYLFKKDIAVCSKLENNYKVLTNMEAVKKIVEKSEAGMIICCGKLYRKSLLCDISFPDGRIHEDEFVTYKLLYKSEKVVISDSEMYYYRQREDSITGSKYNIRRLDKLKALKEAVFFFQLEGNQNMVDLAVYRYLFNIQIAFYRVKYELDNILILKDLKKEYDYIFYNFSLPSNSTISMQKHIVLRFFKLFPNLYCFLVRLFIALFPSLKG